MTKNLEPSSKKCNFIFIFLCKKLHLIQALRIRFDGQDLGAYLISGAYLKNGAFLNPPICVLGGGVCTHTHTHTQKRGM